MLAPVRTSLETDTPLIWNRVSFLPDYVYFNHSIHIHKGVGCVTCHGEIDRMAITMKAHTLRMNWCLNCHRDPAKFIQPRNTVFDPSWTPPPNQLAMGARLVKAYHIHPQHLTSCYTCHR